MQSVGKSSQQIDVINVVLSDSADDDFIAPRTTKSIYECVKDEILRFLVMLTGKTI